MKKHRCSICETLHTGALSKCSKCIRFNLFLQEVRSSLDTITFGVFNTIDRNDAIDLYLEGASTHHTAVSLLRSSPAGKLFLQELEDSLEHLKKAIS
jgi:hypothetical protein